MEETKKSEILKGLIVILVILFLISVMTNGFSMVSNKGIGENDAKEKTLKILNLILQGKSQVEITNIKEENGVYLLDVNVNQQKFNSYLTKDGKLFFPSVINFDKIEKEISDTENNILINQDNTSKKQENKLNNTNAGVNNPDNKSELVNV